MVMSFILIFCCFARFFLLVHRLLDLWVEFCGEMVLKTFEFVGCLLTLSKLFKISIPWPGF